MQPHRNVLRMLTASMARRVGPALLLLLGLAVAIGFQPAPASDAQFIAVLNGGQETPPNDSEFLGVAHLTFDHASKMLGFSITFDGLTTAETAAHFHGPATPGVAAAVLFPLPAGNPKNGAVGPLTAKEIGWLNQGLLYINIHSVMFPGGELRGQVIRTR